MTEQLDFFFLQEDRTVYDYVGHRKTCSSCKTEFYLSEGMHRSRSYCKPCEAAHKRVINRLKKKHKITVNQKCDCCGKSEDELTVHYGKNGQPVSPWRLDHCHETREFRGWLCINCNTGLGRFYDDPDLMRKAISYLQKNRP